MGLKEVKEEILHRAEKDAEGIIAEAQKEAQKIHHETESKVKDYRESAEEATKRMLETMEKRELAQAEFDMRKAVLDKKKEIILHVMGAVKDALANLPEKKKEEYIRHLIEKAKSEIDVDTVYGRPDDKRAIQQVKGVEFKPRESMLGGIVAQTKDGKVSVDYSYGQLLEEIQEQTLQELAKLLFK